MSWLGANQILGSRKRRIGSDLVTGIDENDSNAVSNSISNRQYAVSVTPGNNSSNETVEAALNRLSKAYATAMECVGEMHKAENTIASKKNADPEQLATLAVDGTCSSNIYQTDDDTAKLCIRLARAARNLFENSILLDPLIASELAPTIYYTLTKNDDEEYEKYFQQNRTTSMDHFTKASIIKRKRKIRSRILLNSSGSKSTIQSIAYYSLVNYGDLLFACCTPSSTSVSTVLDRGVVNSLKVLRTTDSVWKREIRVIKNVATVESTAIDRHTDANVEKNLNDTKKEITDTNDKITTDVSSSTNDQDKDINGFSFHLNSQTNSFSHAARTQESYLFDELEVDTVRLALVAYIDATAIDGTDPTVWLKLACAARRLGQLVLQENEKEDESMKTDDTISPRFCLKFHGLERHSLEMAISCSGLNEVPNRTALRALQQLDMEDSTNDQLHEYDSASNAAKEIKVVVDLAKHTWLSFTRFVFNICRDGVEVTGKNITAMSSQDQSKSVITSPLILLCLPPLMGIPSSALQLVCSFMNQRDLLHLQLSCKTIRRNVNSAEANLAQSLPSSNDKKIHATETVTMNSSMLDPNVPQSVTGIVSTDKEMKVEGTCRSSPTKRQASRASSRLRSQMAASEKRAERSNRQQSIRYCLVAAVFGMNCDDERYQETVEDSQSRHEASFTSFLNRESGNRRNDFDQHSEGSGSNAFTLSRFFNDWKQNEVSSPISLLFVIISHASIHACDVFSADSAETDALTTCILEAFELMSSRRFLKESLILSWLGCSHKIPYCTKLTQIQIFALDLLHAELRMKRCDLEDFAETDLDGDWAYLKSFVPFLYHSMAEVEDNNTIDKYSVQLWYSLKTRCIWLMASLCFWRSRTSTNTFDARDAEKDGLGLVEEIMYTLKMPELAPIEVVHTPHLASSKRKELHWYELSSQSLSSLSSEIQASSVVIQAREEFACAIAKITGSCDVDIQEADRLTLVSIGTFLLERYQTSTSSPTAKFTELVDDFLSVHGDSLLVVSRQSAETGDESRLSTWFDSIMRLDVTNKDATRELSSPSILCILASCLDDEKGRRYDLILLFSRLVIALTGQFEALSPDTKPDYQWPEDLPYDPFRIIEDDLNSECVGLGRSSSKSMRQKQVIKQRQYTMLIHLTIGKITSIYANSLSTNDKKDFRQAPEIMLLLQKCISLTSTWFFQTGSIALDGSCRDADFEIFSSIKGFVESFLLDDTADVEQITNQIKTTYIEGMVHILSVQRQTLTLFSKVKPSHQNRPNRIRITRRRAELVGRVCCDLGLMLSRHPFKWDDSSILRSSLLTLLSVQQLVSLVESILYFAKHTFNWETNDINNAAAYLDSFGRDRLRIPIATAIVGVCGSAIASLRCLSRSDDAKEHLNLTEFYDSDCSAVRLVSNKTIPSNPHSTKESTLRVVILSIHCIQNVVSKVSEAEILGYSYLKDYVTNKGPILPLVMSRVLNHFSACLLINFAESNEDQGEAIWSDEYPYGAQSIGGIIDSVLHKTYKYLHGFSLASGLTSEPKDSYTNAGSPSNFKMKEFPPENASAAASLYRCISRTYSQSRRSPPKTALEFVINALPDALQTERRSAINRFLYSDADDFRLRDLPSMVKNAQDLEDYFDQHRYGFVLDCDQEDIDSESEKVRCLVAALMAQGTLPQYQDSGDQNELRLQTSQFEEDLSKKFHAIVEDLLLNNINYVEGWFKASQCLVSKGEIVADRVGLSKGYFRSKKLFTPDKASIFKDLLCTDDLQQKQDNDACFQAALWSEHLGCDLSLFVRHSWSSTTSLLQLMQAIKKQIESSSSAKDTNDVVSKKPYSTIVDEMDYLFTRGDVAKWQSSFGGVFVSSLRKVARRCLCMALYLAQKGSNESKNKLFTSEITESLGILLYSELSCSQTYGYPMHVTPCLRRRELATAALACFQNFASTPSGNSDTKNDGRVTWDLHFMQGKCYEKIAKTFVREKFSVVAEEGSRKYEHYMYEALKAYHCSVVEAIEVEKEGGFVGEKDGGSNHGSSEAIYRLHATRLKCLINAANYGANLEYAEIEALRLTEKHWFSAPGEFTSTNRRERIWNVFVDVVSAMARCRLDHSFFHRSIYRQAQALMWAPVLNDPDVDRLSCSLGTVPAHLACKLRGLNYATNAADSAVVVISSLFEKKRSQLCAVWVTEGGAIPSAFQTLNNCVRKYDSLRGKYISAYVESLRLCKRVKELETFLRWSYTSPRDLPDVFASTANALCDRARQPHTHASLIADNKVLSTSHFLTSVKRITNSALASVVLQEINNASSKEGADFLDDKLKILYACFLRINCAPEIMLRNRNRNVRNGDGAKEVTEALIAVSRKIGMNQPQMRALSTDWSGRSNDEFALQAVIEKCKELYPNLTGGFFSIKKLMKQTKTGDYSTSANAESSSQKMYSVAIPEGLSEGESFVAVVKHGEKKRKIRLTVPDGSPTKLRFSFNSKSGLVESNVKK